MDINDKLILERDIKQLQEQQSRLQDKIEKMERDQLTVLDAKTKLEKEITVLNEKKSEVLKEITEEKSQWRIVQQAEKESLDRQDLDAKKILNRESYVATQELQLKLKEEELTQGQNSVAKRERIIAEKEDGITQKETKADKLVDDKQKLLEKVVTDFGKFKDNVLKEINDWKL